MKNEKMMPEEKLLKIIENPHVSIPKAQAVPKAALGRLKNIKEILKNLRINKDALKKINLRKVNRIAIALCIILTVFWFFDFFRVHGVLNARAAKIQPAPDILAAENKVAMQEKVSVSEVLAGAKKRNIFSSSPSAPQINLVADNQSISDLKLVGILWSENPQAMIENTKEAKTYLVSAGEKIGLLDVRKILKDRVMIGADNWEKELR